MSLECRCDVCRERRLASRERRIPRVNPFDCASYRAWIKRWMDAAIYHDRGHRRWSHG